MKHVRLLTLLATLALGATMMSVPSSGHAQDVADVMAGIVGVKAQINAEARTAEVLGTERFGSGVVIDANGLVLTIGYLVLEAREADVVTQDGREIPADIIAYDSRSGFGLLRARRSLGIAPVKLGDSTALSARDPVLVSSYGGTDLTTPAFVVSREPYAGYWEYLLERPIVVSPPHPAYGGAALLGPEGELLGVGSLALNNIRVGDMSLPGNLFVPIEELKPILGDLLVSGRSSAPPHPWLGVYAREIPGALVVERVAEDGPAAAADVRRGDLLVGLEREAFRSMADFYRLLWAKGDAGVVVELTVLRDGEVLELPVKTADRNLWYRPPILE